MLSILRYPHRSLRCPARPVLAQDKAHLLALRPTLHQACRDLATVGIAANQLGDPLAFCVIAVPNREPFVMVNPAITGGSLETGFEDEGCLSLPGITVAVVRRLRVTVKWKDVEGAAHEEEFGGLAARIVQHELDHLHGTLILDHLSPVKRMKLKSYISRALRMEKENLRVIAQQASQHAAQAVDVKTAMSRRQIEKLVLEGK